MCHGPVDQNIDLEIDVVRFPEILTIKNVREMTSLSQFVIPDMILEINKTGTVVGHIRQDAELKLVDGIVYDLIGFTLHVPGHYYSCVKHPDTGDWYIANDGSVTPVPKDLHPISYARSRSPSVRPLIFMYQKRRNDDPQYMNKIREAVIAKQNLADSANQQQQEPNTQQVPAPPAVEPTPNQVVPSPPAAAATSNQVEVVPATAASAATPNQVVPAPPVADTTPNTDASAPAALATITPNTGTASSVPAPAASGTITPDSVAPVQPVVPDN
jgi:hypothetical protein